MRGPTQVASRPCHEARASRVIKRAISFRAKNGVMRSVLLILPLAFACAAAHAERATERYAPAQISVAQDLLERARAAAALEQYTTAATYAQQAQVDARIAYGMTDAPALRAEAEAIHGAAAALT